MRRAATARLAMAQGVAIGAAGVAVTAGPLTLSSMSGRAGWAGLLIAALTIRMGAGALAAGGSWTGAVGGSYLVASGSGSGSGSGAAAALAAGLLADWAGSAATAIALAASAPLVIALVLSLRERAPGRWAGAPAPEPPYAPEATPAPRGPRTAAS